MWDLTILDQLWGLFFQFCTMKGAKRDIKIILTVFLKEILLYPEQFDYFGTKMVWCPLHFDFALRFFYQFYSRKGTKSYMKICLVVSWETISFEQFDLFRPFFNVWLGVVKIEPGHYYYWIFKIRTWLRFLNSQDMISQVNVYAADSILRY